MDPQTQAVGPDDTNYNTKLREISTTNAAAVISDVSLREDVAKQLARAPLSSRSWDISDPELAGPDLMFDICPPSRITNNVYIGK